MELTQKEKLSRSTFNFTFKFIDLQVEENDDFWDKPDAKDWICGVRPGESVTLCLRKGSKFIKREYCPISPCNISGFVVFSIQLFKDNGGYEQNCEYLGEMTELLDDLKLGEQVMVEPPSFK